MASHESQGLYLRRLAKAQVDTVQISEQGINVLDHLCTLAVNKLTRLATGFVTDTQKVILLRRHVEAAVRMNSNGPLIRQILQKVVSSIERFEESRRRGMPSDASKKRSEAAGLILSVPRIETKMRIQKTCKALSAPSIIAMTAAVEVIMKRVFRNAVDEAKSDRGHKKITPRYIMLAIKNDEDLQIFYKSVRIGGSGAKPHNQAYRTLESQSQKKRKRTHSKRINGVRQSNGGLPKKRKSYG